MRSGRGGFLDVWRCRGEPKYVAAALFHPQTSREDLPPSGGGHVPKWAPE